ncbi:proteic killer suppression protein [Mariprofundus ferrinatatus]|uniref:Proteic killer suppression protein n=1 Tax=Mariprofundus ferrinatatus TaxID=1921087 RepID=A0A2K8L9R8_9PROT|nr:type II toxin-antitoxin system RelE/ParE family toxin [Mariprofundus ferrinatatus]ATX81684.1 proteic killer suppression protein [Mariprofundus ferrinatatus]
MIKTFRDKATAAIFAGKRVKSLPPEIQQRAREKLMLLHHAAVLEDLRIPPANRLEALSGNRQGEHSIRINRQWRICFVWNDSDVSEVEITDYH